MKKLFLFFSLLILCSTGHANGVGNGGDVVFCAKSDQSNYDGYYSLDYMLTLQNGLDDDLVKPATLVESQARLTKLLKASCKNDSQWNRDPDFGDKYDIFNKLRSNHDDWQQPYIWLTSSYGLVDINDERMARMLPPNCLKDGKPNIIQAIIRKTTGFRSIVVFEYDPKIESALMQRPLQESFLLMHEFLWGATEDVDHVRWANHLLHSQKYEKMDPAESRRVINDLLRGANCGL